MIIFLSFFQQKRIDLEKGAFLNYEGTSGITFLLIISAIAPLGIFYLVVSFAIHQQYMVLALTVVVIIAFSCQKIFRNFLINRMKKNMKYQLSENFNRV
jgi:ABC-type protease/lipase transport system fused ATPase/permease subunit